MYIIDMNLKGCEMKFSSLKGGEEEYKIYVSFKESSKH